MRDIAAPAKAGVDGHSRQPDGRIRILQGL
jgi:hypothetical protein